MVARKGTKKSSGARKGGGKGTKKRGGKKSTKGARKSGKKGGGKKGAKKPAKSTKKSAKRTTGRAATKRGGKKRSRKSAPSGPAPSPIEMYEEPETDISERSAEGAGGESEAESVEGS